MVSKATNPNIYYNTVAVQAKATGVRVVNNIIT